MNRANLVCCGATLLAACLAGCGGASEVTRPTPPVLSTFELGPSQSYIHVTDRVAMQTFGASAQGVPVDPGPVTFSSSDPSRVSVDSHSGIATAKDTGTVTITATMTSGSHLSAVASIWVLPAQSPDVFATDSLTLTPPLLVVKMDEAGHAHFVAHFGHVAHHLQLSADYGYSRDLDVHSDTSVTIGLRNSDIDAAVGGFTLRCLIHPSMTSKVVVQ